MMMSLKQLYISREQQQQWAEVVTALLAPRGFFLNAFSRLALIFCCLTQFLVFCCCCFYELVSFILKNCSKNTI